MQISSIASSRAVALRKPAARRPSRRSARVQALSVPPEYGFVMASVAFTAGVTQWLAIRVMQARKRYNVPYPTMYAPGADEDSTKFNWTQRSHQNMLEVLPNQLAMQILVGLVYPRAAAVQGLVWTVGRIIYALGYSSGGPDKRVKGGTLSFFAYVALFLTTLTAGVRLALGAA